MIAFARVFFLLISADESELIFRRLVLVVYKWAYLRINAAIQFIYNGALYEILLYGKQKGCFEIGAKGQKGP